MRELMPNPGDATMIARRVRVLRHRTMRWFQPPIRTVVRDRLSSLAREMRSRDEN